MLKKRIEGKCILCKKRIGDYAYICHDCYENLSPVRMQVTRSNDKPSFYDDPCSTAPRLLQKGLFTSLIVYPLGNILLIEKVKNRFLHAKPCLRCKDHPKTVIPLLRNGIV